MIKRLKEGGIRILNSMALWNGSLRSVVCGFILYDTLAYIHKTNCSEYYNMQFQGLLLWISVFHEWFLCLCLYWWEFIYNLLQWSFWLFFLLNCFSVCNIFCCWGFCVMKVLFKWYTLYYNKKLNQGRKLESRLDKEKQNISISSSHIS